VTGGDDNGKASRVPKIRVVDTRGLTPRGPLRKRTIWNRFHDDPVLPKPQPMAQEGEEMIVVSLAEGQDQFACEIEALSDDDARDAFAALVSIVHQMARLKAGHALPIALDEIEVFVRSFETYVNHLDELSPETLETNYETVRCSIAIIDGPPNLRHGAKALMVIILGEMIRREGLERGAHNMSGYKRASAMIDRLNRTFAGKGLIGDAARHTLGEEAEESIQPRTREATSQIGIRAEKYGHAGEPRDVEITSMINNKWTHGKTHFVLPPLPPELRCSEGILPWRLALDPKAGSEMVLLLLDRTPFIHDLAKVRPFDLRLKTGLVRTSHGHCAFCCFTFQIQDIQGPFFLR